MYIFYIFKIKILEKINSAVLLEAVADLIQRGHDDGAPRSGLRKVNVPHPTRKEELSMQVGWQIWV